MNFEDEPYIRKYIRRTLTSKRLKWEGRAVLNEMEHEFDRAGVFEFQGDLVDAVETMTDLPRKVVEVGLKRVLETETWVVRDGVLFWPKFLHAQTCTRSDAARQRESRERRRALAHARTILGQESLGDSVTGCDDSSRNVTDESETVHDGHVSSQGVTLHSAALHLAGSNNTNRAGESSAPELRSALPERLVSKPRSEGKPPKRHDPLGERVRVQSWFPSQALLEWAKGEGLTDDDVDRTLTELRDGARGQHDFDWFDETALKYFEESIRRKKHPRGVRAAARGPLQTAPAGYDPFAKALAANGKDDSRGSNR